MRIKSINTTPYQFKLLNNQIRSGCLIEFISDHNHSALSDLAPYPSLNKETLKDALMQLDQIKLDLLQMSWREDQVISQLGKLRLLPSLQFALESGLYSLTAPVSGAKPSTSALFMGSSDEIKVMAKKKAQEGVLSAKLKVSQLEMKEAFDLIEELKDHFFLRIDVNRAWDPKDSLEFFSHFPIGTFDYVEEPFINPQDLIHFTHPLAVDESYPNDLSLKDLEKIPCLKALIYKPTVQGGFYHLQPIQKWAENQGIDLVLSSSFESDVGLYQIASMAKRLGIKTPVGLGTYDYLPKYFLPPFFYNS